MSTCKPQASRTDAEVQQGPWQASTMTGRHLANPLQVLHLQCCPAMRNVGSTQCETGSELSGLGTPAGAAGDTSDPDFEMDGSSHGGEAPPPRAGRLTRSDAQVATASTRGQVSAVV